MTITLLLLLTSVMAASPADGPAAASASAPAEFSPEVRALVEQLGDPRFEVREKATRTLCQADFTILPALVDRYRAEPAHEPKLRLREVIENLFFRKQMQGEVGFLGIQLSLAQSVFDLAAGRTSECVFAQKVLKGFPAEQAGMMDGDIIVSLDGKPVSWFFGAAPPPTSGPAPVRSAVANPARPLSMTNEKIDRFTQHIKRRTPGSKVAARVLRALSPRRVTVGAAAEPAKTLDGASFIPVPGSMIGAGALSTMNTRGGLLVRSVSPGSPAQLATLKPQDIVAGINGVPLPAETDPATIGQYFTKTSPGSPVTIEVIELKEVSLTVTIGRRPVSRLNPQDLIEAQENFALWWRDQTGETSIQRPTPDRSYRIPTEQAGPLAPEAGVEP